MLLKTMPSCKCHTRGLSESICKIEYIFLKIKHPHSGCPCIIHTSKLHSNMSSFNSTRYLKGRENVCVTHELSFAFSCRCAAIINHTKDSDGLNLISCYIFIKPVLLMLNSEGTLQSPICQQTLVLNVCLTTE